jgi:hypothetical protein
MNPMSISYAVVFVGSLAPMLYDFLGQTTTAS